MPMTFGFDPATAENIARLITIVRGDEIIRFTDYGEELEPVSGEAFQPEPTTMSAMQFQVDGSVSNADIKISARSDGPIDDSDVMLGRYDGASMLIECCDTANPSGGTGVLFSGLVGSTTTDRAGVITITARGPLTYLRADMSEVYGAMCRADLGDERCGNGPGSPQILPPEVQRMTSYAVGDFVRGKVYGNGNPSDYGNLYMECTVQGATGAVAPAYNPAIGGDTMDGTAVFTGRNAWLRSCQVGTILSTQAFSVVNLDEPRAVADWFKLGTAIVRSGRFTGSQIPIRKSTPTTDVHRIDSFVFCSYMIEAGTWLEIHRGCAKTEFDCFNVFNNIFNRRAEPFAPNRDLVMAQA